MYKTLIQNEHHILKVLDTENVTRITSLKDIPNISTRMYGNVYHFNYLKIDPEYKLRSSDYHQINKVLEEKGITADLQPHLKYFNPNTYIDFRLTDEGLDPSILSSSFLLTRRKKWLTKDIGILFQVVFKASSHSKPITLNFGIDVDAIETVRYCAQALTEEVRRMLRSRLGPELPDMTIELCENQDFLTYRG